MIIRNDGPKMARVFGMELQPGIAETVRDGLPPNKVAYLKANFTVVDEPKPAPVVKEPAPVDAEAPPEVAKPTRKKATKKRSTRRTFGGN